MSTRTSKALLLLAALAVAGCDGALPAFDGLNVTRRAPERIALPGGVVVAGAKGWCVDGDTTRASGDAAVVVLGSCAAIAGNAFAPRPKVPGVVTVSIERAVGAIPPASDLEAFFATDAGRAALARDGRAESVRILETRREDGLLFVHAEDRSAGSVPGVSTDFWRALFVMDGRFVSVSLVGLTAKPIARRDGLATLEAQVDELKTANPG